jgi:UDP-2,3-diacylglucosamine hydrolase
LTERWLFVSDVHVPVDGGERARLFLAFLSTAAQQARGLFVLGDLFDLYIGARAARRPGVREISDALARLREQGTRLVFLAGNRDFQVGPELPFDEIHPDLLVLELQGQRLLLCHGDLLCSRDRSYARARHLLRSRPVAWLAGALPVPLVLGTGRALRWYSTWVVGRKGGRVTDLAVEAVLGAYREQGADAIIAGHVHRERDLVGEVDGRSRRFVGLGAWDAQGSYAELTGGRLRLRRFRELPSAPPAR